MLPNHPVLDRDDWCSVNRIVNNLDAVFNKIEKLVIIIKSLLFDIKSREDFFLSCSLAFTKEFHYYPFSQPIKD